MNIEVKAQKHNSKGTRMKLGKATSNVRFKLVIVNLKTKTSKNEIGKEMQGNSFWVGFYRI